MADSAVDPLAPPCEDLLSEQYRHIWCGLADDTGRYVCRRVRDHRRDFHAGRNTADGIHQWKVQGVDGDPENMPAAIPATDPANDLIGAVRIEQHDGGHSVWQHVGGTPGNEWMCVWSTAHGNEGCTLPPEDVAGFPTAGAVPGTPAVASAGDGTGRLVDALLTGLETAWRDADDLRSSREGWAVEAMRLDVENERLLAEPDGDLRQRIVAALSEQVSEFISPDEFGGYDSHYGELVDIVLDVVRPELERREAELRQSFRNAGLATNQENRLRAELSDVRASREAWAIEADRLDAIATAACLVTHPRECGRDESDCTNDDSCPRAEERYATADDLIGAMALSEEVVQLTRERDEARAELDGLEKQRDAWWNQRAAERDTLSKMLRGMARRAVARRRAYSRLAKSSKVGTSAYLRVVDAVEGVQPYERSEVTARRIHAMRAELEKLRARPAIPADRPRVVCLSGSMRFEAEMREAARHESVKGHIVVMPNCNMKHPHELWASDEQAESVKTALDGLHFAKIDLADEVIVVSDATGYVGDSTRSEIAYAEAHGKPVRYWPAPVSSSDTTEDGGLR